MKLTNMKIEDDGRNDFTLKTPEGEVLMFIDERVIMQHGFPNGISSEKEAAILLITIGMQIAKNNRPDVIEGSAE